MITSGSKLIIRYWFPVVIWMGVIFWMSTGSFSSDNTSLFIEPILHFLFPGISTTEVASLHGWIRKAGHVTEYLILGMLLFRAFRSESGQPWRLRWSIQAAIVLLIYALSDEFHQSYVATRTASIIDVGIDLAGGMLALFAIAIRYHPRR